MLLQSNVKEKHNTAKTTYMLTWKGGKKNFFTNRQQQDLLQGLNETMHKSLSRLCLCSSKEAPSQKLGFHLPSSSTIKHRREFPAVKYPTYKEVSYNLFM